MAVSCEQADASPTRQSMPMRLYLVIGDLDILPEISKDRLSDSPPERDLWGAARKG